MAQPSIDVGWFSQRGRRDDVIATVVAIVLGLVAIGPGLGSGPLLNLDLIAAPTVRVPQGMWGLGPPLTQRVPLGAIEAWIGALIGGPAAIKLLMVSGIALAFVGMERACRPAPAVARYGAALFYAAGPYALTRGAIGHLNVLWALAWLPWTVSTLLAPSRSGRRTFLAVFVLGLGGTASGILGLAVLVVGWLTESERRIVTAAWAAVASLPWLVPNIVAVAVGASVQGADTFGTNLEGPGGLPRLMVGGGFWIPDNQLGGTGLAAAAAGVAAVALMVLGRRAVRGAWGPGAPILAVTGLFLASASAIPGVDRAWDLAVASPVGAPLREGHRFLLLFLVVACPALAHGAADLARRVRPELAPAALTSVLALGLVVSVPAVLDTHRVLTPRRLPDGWTAAAKVIEAQPGTTLVLPWHLYYRASFAGDRTVLNPAPDVLGGDTISSYDPEVGGGQEQLDRRADPALDILADYRSGAEGAAPLAKLGVRWVFVAQEFDWAVFGAPLADDPGLSAVPVGNGALLYEVTDWRGPLVTPDGTGDQVDGPVAALKQSPDPGGLWAIPGTGGWLRGLEPVPVSEDGLLDVPEGGGVLWYWPAAIILLGDAVALVGAGMAADRWRRNRHQVPRPYISMSSASDAISTIASREGGATDP